ncbi:MAG: asparagine synthase C-terminal domain-containing protein, partial [Alcaligenaceae bacterium]|nr:asparagine synthase C-terminal domain-containing protein [Alcaligenaceae bacterium]
WVDRVNVYTQATPHKVVVNAAELATDLDDMIRSQGEPFGSTSIYAQYRVFKLAREQGITVTLDGQGADEMLAGYIGYPGQRIRSLVEAGQFRQALSFLNEWSKWPGRNRLLGAKYAVSEMTDGWLYKVLRSIGGRGGTKSWINYGPLQDQCISVIYPRQRPTQVAPGRRVVSELAFALTRRGLPGLLRHGDRNSMRFSVESRVPFLTLDLVDLMLSLPENYLISSAGETKHVFRAAMRGIVPDDVLDRRDKIGFETPEYAWLVSMADTIRSWLRVDLGLPFLNQKEIVREFDEVISGTRPFSWQIWRWINFSRWYTNEFLR